MKKINNKSYKPLIINIIINKKAKANIWDILAWIVLFGILVWLVLKTFGVIKWCKGIKKIQNR